MGHIFSQLTGSHLGYEAGSKGTSLDSRYPGSPISTPMANVPRPAWEHPTSALT